MVYYNIIIPTYLGSIIPYITQPTRVFFVAHLANFLEPNLDNPPENQGPRQTLLEQIFC